MVKCLFSHHLLLIYYIFIKDVAYLGIQFIHCWGNNVFYVITDMYIKLKILSISLWSFSPRFLVGPYDEHGFCKEEKLSYPPTRQFVTDDLDFFSKLSIKLNYKFKEMIHKIKIFSSHQSCPHPFSCLYYTLQVGK